MVRMIISDIWNLEIICMPRRYLFRGSPFFLSDSEHGKLLRSFLDQRKIWSPLFSRRGLSNILIMVKLLQANGNYLIWSTQMQKVFWQTLTDLTIITAQYVYFHTQSFSVISCFTAGRSARPTSKKTQFRQN